MASKIYTNIETVFTFKDTGASGLGINTNGITLFKGSFSDQYDRGAGAHAALYRWVGQCEMNSAGVVGETVDLYVSPADDTTPNGPGYNSVITSTTKGSASSITGTTQLANLLYMGSIVVDTTDNSKLHTAQGIIFIPSRYMQLVVWNNTTKTLKTTNDINFVSFYPIPFESQ